MADVSRSAGTDPVVMALGGNTLLGEDGTWNDDDQREAIARSAKTVAEAVYAGNDVVLTHGNGPQVGNLLLEVEQSSETPTRPLDVLVAETQAQIGYVLQQELGNALAGVADVVSLVTQVQIDPEDPAFDNPSKPIGPTYTPKEAEERPFPTQPVANQEGSRRRVVPSPEPRRIVERDQIRSLVQDGTIAICGGGGGVPVIDDGGLTGVEAVVDKDYTSYRLGLALSADRLIFLTDVPYAYLGFQSNDPEPLREVTPERMRQHLEKEAFGVGSMRPKVDAAVRFVEASGGMAAITTPDRCMAALDGADGTIISQG